MRPLIERRMLVSAVDNGAPECELDVPTARQAAQQLLEWACWGEEAPPNWAEWASFRGADTPGMLSLGPQAQAVTEGRNGLSKQQDWHHSSCGDLPGWMWQQLGVRARWLNRATLPAGYRIGENLQVILEHPDFVRSPTFDDELLQVGDVVFIGGGNRGHVEVVLHHDLETRRMCVATYGQDGRGKNGRDGRVRRYDCRGRMIRGGREAIGYLTLDAVMRRASAEETLELAMLPAGSEIGVPG